MDNFYLFSFFFLKPNPPYSIQYRLFLQVIILVSLRAFNIRMKIP